MKQDTTRKTMWSMAGTAGLALGLVSTAYMFLTILLEKVEINVFLNSLLSFILWGAKFAGCIWLMRQAMKKFAAVDESITNRDTFAMGTATALLSALIFAAMSFANVAYFCADMYAEQINLVMQQMAPMMDSNSMSMMDDMMQSLPQITFFSNLIYCFLFGCVLSAILSRNIPSKDPFADYKPEEQ